MRKWCALRWIEPGGLEPRPGLALVTENGQWYHEEPDELVRLLLALAGDHHTFVAYRPERLIAYLRGELGLDITTHLYDGQFGYGRIRGGSRRSPAEIWSMAAMTGQATIEQLLAAVRAGNYELPQRLQGRDPDRYRWLCVAHNAGECAECYALDCATVILTACRTLDTVCAGWGIEPRRTIAGTARAVWLALDQPPPCYLRQPKIRRLAREAYLGGRVEAYKLGRMGPVYVADMRSAYGAALAQPIFPDPEHLVHLIRPGPAGGWLSRDGVVAATVSIPPTYVPPLPYTHRGARTYPAGSVAGCWTIRELRHAIETGARLLHADWAVFARENLRPFATTIDVLWALRTAYQDSDPYRADLARWLLRALAGRLGSSGELGELISAPLRWKKLDRDLPGRNWRQEGNAFVVDRHKRSWVPDDHRNVLWAAQVTGWCRARLHQHLVNQGGSLVACDTDSVFSLAPITGLAEGIGELEDKGLYPQLIMLGPGRYRAQQPDGSWRNVARGVPAERAEELLSQGWTDSSNGRYARLYSRVPLNPEVLASGVGWSDTAVPIVSPLA